MSCSCCAPQRDVTVYVNKQGLVAELLQEAAKELQVRTHIVVLQVTFTLGRILHSAHSQVWISFTDDSANLFILLFSPFRACKLMWCLRG